MAATGREPAHRDWWGPRSASAGKSSSGPGLPLHVPRPNNGCESNGGAACDAGEVRESRLLSVIMIACQAEEYIHEAVRCVLASELPPGSTMELLIGVDGCADTWEAVKDIEDRRVGVLRNFGTYVTSNTLWACSAGEVVTRSDADDAVDPTRLRKMLEPLIADPSTGWSNTYFNRVSEHLTVLSGRASRRLLHGGRFPLVCAGGAGPLVGQG